MRLRNKILIAITLVWIIFLIISYVGARYYLMGNYLALEEDQVEKNLTRVDHSLKQMVYSLHSLTYDWSHWNEAYNYLEGTNPQFPANNLTIQNFSNKPFNLLSYWDNEGKLIVGSQIDSAAKTLTPFSAELTRDIYPHSLFIKANKNNQDMTGFILLDKKIMLVASSRISDGKNIKTPLGVMLTGRILTPEVMQSMQDSLLLKLKLLLMDESQKTPYQSIIESMIQHNQNHALNRMNDSTVEGVTLIRDITNKPIGAIVTLMDRSIYLNGLRTIKYFFWSFVILGIIFAILLNVLIRYLVIKRLEELDKNVVRIQDAEEINERITIKGKDEISSLSTEINNMLTKIQSQQDKLKYRMKKSSAKLEETSTKLQQEITEKKSIEDELLANKEHLKRLAYYDSLTNLPNRVYFNESLNKYLVQADNKSFALLLIDIDRFKNINDGLGHAAGDIVIQEISQRFKKLLRNIDLLARLGGDEFIILLKDIADPKEASDFGEKLLEICAKLIAINNTELFVTVSIGICVYPTDGKSLEDLQKNADTAMYRAKRAGGNVFNFFSKDMNMQSHEKIKLEASLRKALTNHEFVLYYQPKLNLKDWSIEGVEALIRWESPDLGMVSPIKFIPLAEETGIILQIGEWALREACKANKRWQKQGYQPIIMAVNLSLKQFRHKDIAQLVKDVLNETELDPQYLELEITESSVMENVELATRKLNEIKAMGVSISIDDFGTGYTSINYLKQLPVSALKIDQSFVKGIPQKKDDLAIISAVISMAHNLNIKVVAEGVETADQLQYLIEHHCDIVQGYFFSRPLVERKIITQFNKH